MFWKSLNIDTAIERLGFKSKRHFLTWPDFIRRLMPELLSCNPVTFTILFARGILKKVALFKISLCLFARKRQNRALNLFPAHPGLRGMLPLLPSPTQFHGLAKFLQPLDGALFYTLFM